MSKKFIYFRFTETGISETHSAFRPSFKMLTVEWITNVFQLSLQNELRFIISKDDSLQKALTLDLPRIGGHGALWQGREWPEIETLLRQSLFLHSVFLFSREEEPDPALLTGAYQRFMRRWKILNWRVVQLPAFVQLLRRIGYLRGKASHEAALGKMWHAFKSQWTAMAVPAPQESDQRNHIRPGQNGSTRKAETTVLLPAILNQSSILVGSEGFPSGARPSVVFVKPKEYDWIHAQQLKGGAIALAGAPLEITLRARLFQLRDRFNALDFSGMISNLIYNLRRLVLTTVEVQTDLFYNELEKRFMAFAGQEKQRLRAGLSDPLSPDFEKFILAANFLLTDAQMFNESHKREFALLAYWQTLREILKKKGKVKPFPELFHQKLRELYLDFYAFDFVEEWGMAPDGDLEILNDLKTLVTKKFDRIIVDLRGAGKKRDPKTNRMMGVLLPQTVFEAGEELPEPSFIPPEVSVSVEEITGEGSHFARMNKPAQSVLTRLVSENKWPAARQLLELWMNVFYFFILYADAQQEAPDLVMLAEGAPLNAAFNHSGAEWPVRIGSFFRGSFPEGSHRIQVLAGGQQVNPEPSYFVVMIQRKVNDE